MLTYRFIAQMGALVVVWLLAGCNPSPSSSTAEPAPHSEVRQDSAPTTQTIRWEGRIALWKRQACEANESCGLPEALAAPQPARVEFQAPTAPGNHLVAEQTYLFKDWTVVLSVYWVNPPPSASASPYVVTQIKLSEKLLGALAECSRYDGVEELKFLPPGSCAGRDGAMLYGVSVMSPPPPVAGN